MALDFLAPEFFRCDADELQLVTSSRVVIMTSKISFSYGLREAPEVVAFVR